jgi:hypothetical protein
MVEVPVGRGEPRDAWPGSHRAWRWVALTLACLLPTAWAAYHAYAGRSGVPGGAEPFIRFDPPRPGDELRRAGLPLDPPRWAAS